MKTGGICSESSVGSGRFRNHRMDGPGQSSSSSSEGTMFNVHWDDFNRVVVDSLWALLAEESLTDCTLVVSPSEQVQVHRVVLSANSPYFRSLLTAHSHHPNPIIILQDVSYSTLKMLVMFMYRGQVSVNSEEMTSLLRAAEHLQIIGLTQTRRSPINFQPLILTPSSAPSPPAHLQLNNSSLHQNNSSNNGSSAPPPVSSSTSGQHGQGSSGTAPEAQTVYSKKSRILEQNKSVMNFSRDYEISNDRAAEQQSPLSLKKEDEAESGGDWEDKHMDIEHTTTEPSTLCLRYCCPYCSTNFPSQSSLSRHIMILHPTVYSTLYETLPPSASASSISPSIHHPDSPHVKQPPLSPPNCEHGLNHCNMDGHEEMGDGSGFICKYCGKPFPEASQLLQHLPIHTGERPFKCEFCGKAFKLRHHMKDHARVHTGERPFRCGLCGKNFSRSTILKAHEKTHFPKGSIPPGGPSSTSTGGGNST